VSPCWQGTGRRTYDPDGLEKAELAIVSDWMFEGACRKELGRRIRDGNGRSSGCEKEEQGRCGKRCCERGDSWRREEGSEVEDWNDENHQSSESEAQVNNRKKGNNKRRVGFSASGGRNASEREIEGMDLAEADSVKEEENAKDESTSVRNEKVMGMIGLTRNQAELFPTTRLPAKRQIASHEAVSEEEIEGWFQTLP